jgi:hypothetical protein
MPVPPLPAHPQGARVCRALLALVDAQDLWTPTGPAPSAGVASRSAGPDARRVLAVCWVFWEGSSTLSLCELLRLSPPTLEAVGELIAAFARGGAAVEAWLSRFERREAARPRPAACQAAELERFRPGVVSARP